MLPPKQKLKIWVDTETTGLEDNCQLLEVAIVITDETLSVKASIWRVVHVERENVWELMVPCVQEMHTKNGLLVDCQDSNHTLESIDLEIEQFLQQHTQGIKYPVAGNSVHFDVKVLCRLLPSFGNCVDYKIVDVTSCWIVKNDHFPKCHVVKRYFESPHRALDDVFDSIEQLRAIVDTIEALFAERNKLRDKVAILESK